MLETISSKISLFFQKHLFRIISIGGIGRARIVPGTWASLVAIMLASIFGPKLLCILTGIVILLGWWASEQYVLQTGKEDPGVIVIDEIAGQWLAVLLVMATLHKPLTFWAYFTLFILFRLFDIWKPGPIGWADRNIKGGFGVMADDVLAGLAAGITTYLIFQ